MKKYFLPTVYLLAAFVIFLTLFFGAKNYVMPYYYAATLDSELKHKYPIFRILATYYPKEYQAYIEETKKEIITNGRKNISPASKLINYAVSQSMAFATPKEIYHFLQINYEIENKLYSINPMLVLALEIPGKVPSQPFIFAEMSESDFNQLMQVRAQLIEAGSKNKIPINYSDSEIERARVEIKTIMVSLTEKYGKEVMIDTLIATSPFINPAQSAQVMLSLNESYLAKGEEEGGFLYKILTMIGNGQIPAVANH